MNSTQVEMELAMAASSEWRAKELDEEKKEEVRTLMRRLQTGLEAKGGVTMENAKKMVRHRTMQVLTEKWEANSADIAWAWVAERQTQGDLLQLWRKRPGTGRLPEGHWQTQAAMRAGWTCFLKERMSKGAADLLRVADRVMGCLEAKLRPGMSERTGGQEGSEGMCALQVTAKEMAAVWQAQKSGFRGSGGEKAFWGAVEVLMLQGRVEGDVGRSPTEGDWVELAKRVTGIDPVIRRRMGSIGAAKSIRVYLDLGAATQSSRREAEAKGLYYVGLDTREWVYSAKERTWVQNYVCDYTAMSPAELWEVVQRLVREDTGWEGRIVLTMVWGSPPCHTYTIIDLINQARGCNYRDHTLPHKPPTKGSSKYAKEARRSDCLVQHMLKIMEMAAGMGAAWAIENPVGNLKCRPFMVTMRLRHKMVVVDYCAYEGVYKKPTNLWTNLDWKPQGTQGCQEGRCSNACRGGSWGQRGRWVHKFKIAQGSWEAAGGPGRRAMKEEVPAMLHREMLENLNCRL